MKKFFILFCLFFFLYKTYAQSYTQGSIMKPNGDSTSGCIRLDYSNKFIRFKVKCSGAVISYSVSDLSAFRLSDLIYERQKIGEELVFLQKIVSGEAQLYRLTQKPFRKDRYFLKLGDVIEELTFSKEEVVVDNQRYLKSDSQFLKTFSRLLSDCNEFTNSKWGTAFTSDVLIGIVDAYNNCKQRDGSGLKSMIHPMSTPLPTKFFIRLGINTALLPSPIVRETKALYTRHVVGSSGSLSSTPNYAFDDQGSVTQANWGSIASVGMEHKLLGGKVSMGGQLSYSTSQYDRHILTGGTTDAYTDQYNYVTLQNYETSVPKGQLIHFDGAIKEKTAIVQINIFVRKYLFTDKAAWFIGTGISYGLVRSTYTSSIKLYSTDTPTHVYLGDMIRYAQPYTAQTGQAGGIFEVGWQRNSKFGLLAQYNWLYVHQIGLLLNYNF